MKKEQIIAKFNQYRPPFLDLLQCEIIDLDLETGMCTMNFDIGPQYCHSVDIVQGGFVTAMLDAVSSHAVFATIPGVVGVSTLELKVSFFEVSRQGKMKAIGRIEKKTRNFAFVSADLYNPEGERTASLTATSKLIRQKN